VATSKHAGPVAASIDRNGGDTQEVGVAWTGRWGFWEQDGVHLLAVCVGVLEVFPTSSASGVEVLDAACPEVERALDGELPEGTALAMVHWVPSASPALHRNLRVAILGEMAVCQELQKKWKYRVCCSGLVTVNWSYTFDTTSVEHNTRMTNAARKVPGGEHGFRLELPPRWLAEEVCYRCTPIVPTNHWWQFSALFGEVVTALLIGSSNGPRGVVHLLVYFKEPQAPLCMWETLTDRYMYNPVNNSMDDIHYVNCEIGNFDTLLKTLMHEVRDVVPSGAPGADDAGEAPFVLRRCCRAEIQGLLSQPPELVPITPGRRRLVVGREDVCDIVVRHMHVSKAHATLELQEAFSRPGWLLMLQDSSSNGTWLNGSKLTTSHLVQLLPGARISLLMPRESLEDDPLTYEVTLGANMQEVGDVGGGIVAHIRPTLQAAAECYGQPRRSEGTDGGGHRPPPPPPAAVAVPGAGELDLPSRKSGGGRDRSVGVVPAVAHRQVAAPSPSDALSGGDRGECSTTADPSRQQQQHPSPNGGGACPVSADAPVTSAGVARDRFANTNGGEQVHEHERNAELEREWAHDMHRSRRHGHSRRDGDLDRDRDHDRDRARTRRRSRSRYSHHDQNRKYNERNTSGATASEIQQPCQTMGQGAGGVFGGGGSGGSPAVAAGGEGPPYGSSTGTEDLGEWLASIEGGCLVPYFAKLDENFDTVSQICTLYRDSVECFFEDFAEIQAKAHQQAFKRAILARAAGEGGGGTAG